LAELVRTQRRPAVNVILVHITTTRDMGNENQSATGILVKGAIFNPSAPLERPSPDQASVFQPAFFDVPGVFDVDADDLVHVTALEELPADPEELDTLLQTITSSTWQVDGGASVWGDRTKVPVVQARKT
jgi:hypothetical protein